MWIQSKQQKIKQNKKIILVSIDTEHIQIFGMQGVDFSYVHKTNHSTAYCSSHKYLCTTRYVLYCMFSYIIFSKSTLFSYDYAEYYFCLKQKWCENSIYLRVRHIERKVVVYRMCIILVYFRLYSTCTYIFYVIFE